ncbi:hypothetical protein F2Q69_00021722 [Brassica cretica]|uniref:Uncharacterized protein n=1 Tax=Brassica cretica TaxID=69181 RepID=A0A8S9Q820_BRACR|nr:hypothetical protein F2Q69_00021722 [Brassica cretica]
MMTKKRPDLGPSGRDMNIKKKSNSKWIEDLGIPWCCFILGPLVLEYHMEFLETFGYIWSSREVIRVIFGRALPGATFRSDYMKSL